MDMNWNRWKEIESFILYEAELLDDHHYEEWLNLFTDDVKYEMPIWLSRASAEGKVLSNRFKLMDETKETLNVRIKRLGTSYAWAEDPPSRTRHYISNIRINETKNNEVNVRCNLLLYRNRSYSAEHEIFSADRQNILRKAEAGWKIAYRCAVLE